jgi:hypothetical protein
MEFTEDMLRRIANNIADLRLKFSLAREVLVQIGAYPETMDRVMAETIETPDFQQLRDQVYEQLKGGH